MQGYLVRVAVDQTYGAWNAPVNPGNNEFVFVPIPEEQTMRTEMATPYRTLRRALARFKAANPSVPADIFSLPQHLSSKNMHLDPDFEHLTYGDSGTRRGRGLTRLRPGDVVAFYSGLKPIAPRPRPLLYALIGLSRRRGCPC